MTTPSSTTLSGTVEKIIHPADPRDSEKAQIGIDDADHLYREIRIENKLVDEKGRPVRLKEGATEEVTVEASQQDTTDRVP